MRCPSCATDNVTQIDIEVSIDDSLTFYSCRKCEEKWWDRDGATISLDEVLDLSGPKQESARPPEGPS